MSTLIQCLEETCIETFIEASIATLGAILSVNGFRIIFRDRNKLLNRLNKIIYGIAMGQLILLSVYFIFWGSDFVISSIRCLRILNEILLCILFSEMVFEEILMNKLMIIFKVVAVFIFVEWFWTAIINQSTYDYFCLEPDYIFLSGTTLILALSSCFFGFTAVDQLRSYQSEMQQSDQAEADRKCREIQLFLAVNCISAIFQFAWDYIAKLNSKTLEDCYLYYEAYNIQSIFYIAFMKIITLMLSPFAIYYVLYFKTRNQFNNRLANVIDFEVLWDRRSEIAHKLTQA
ncbi:hypothetical protein pb186bvf_001363 [Paramecium bursaria]